MTRGSVVPEVIALRSSASRVITSHGLVMTSSTAMLQLPVGHSDPALRLLALMTPDGPKRVCDRESAKAASQAIARLNRRSKMDPRVHARTAVLILRVREALITPG